MTNELALTNQYAIMPVMGMEQALARYQAVVDFTKRIMKEGTDYGVIPGTGDKPTLLKPGAEKLNSLFGLSPRFEIVEKATDWTGSAHEGEPFFYYHYRCELYRGDMLVGTGLGSCNSWEKKYRYRRGERICPNCGQATIIKGRQEYGGGWLCYAKKGGCGAKWGDGDAAIESQSVGDVKNPNPADLVNTIDKMAQKRALVAATLIATNASEYFTQDIEDIYDGNWSDVVNVTPVSPPRQVEAPKPNGNGQRDEWVEPVKIDTKSNLFKSFMATGSELYGDEWDDKRPQLVRHISKGQHTSSAELSFEQVQTLLNGMQDKLMAKEAETA